MFSVKDYDGKNSKHASTQYNFYLLAKNNLKDKSVTCNINRKQRTRSTQSNIIGEPLKVGSLKITERKLSKSTRCEEKHAFPRRLSKSTQYEKKLLIPVATKSTQCFDSKAIIYKHQSTQCFMGPLFLNSSMESSVNSPKFHPKSTFEKYSQTGSGTQNSYFSEVTKLIDLHFSYELCHEIKEDCNGHNILMVTRKRAIGLFSSHDSEPITVIIKEDGSCIVCIIFKEPETFSILSEDDSINVILLKDLLLKLTGRLGHVFCPGVNPSKLEGSTDFTKPKSLVKIDFPCLRYQSSRCEIFYQSRTEVILPILKVKLQQCKSCANVTEGLRKAKQRRAAETPTIKLKRLRISSNYPIKFLSPRNQILRVARIQKERCFLKRKLAQLEQKMKIRDLELTQPHS